MPKRPSQSRIESPRSRLKPDRRVTLIVFCREPRPGYCKTRLIPRLGAAGAAQLGRAFLVDALAKCRALDPARLVLAAAAANGAANSGRLRRIARRFGAELTDQGKGGLGERMARALAPYRLDGAILIGTDTPSLPMHLLEQSVAMLRRAPTVISPSLDGGYYLLGIRGELPDIFRAIAWGSARAFRQTVERLQGTGARYALGPAWYDVDRYSDVLLLAAHIARMSKHRGLEPRHEGSKEAARRTVRAALPCPETARALARLGLLCAGR
jgi:rSAM/selenodomain-associated transferase 1